MARVDLLLPKMGESIMEATILKWLKQPGDKIALDETIVEIATDKVDSEIPSPIGGTVLEILYPENEVVEIGKVIAVIGTEGEEVGSYDGAAAQTSAEKEQKPSPSVIEEVQKPIQSSVQVVESPSNSDKFYSPLVKNIAKEEGVSSSELNAINGSGAGGRVTKRDILDYIDQRKSGGAKVQETQQNTTVSNTKTSSQTTLSSTSSATASSISGDVEIVEMDRMRKLIADHMVMSKHTSPHVTSFVEADVTNVVVWREKNKSAFNKQYGEKITFTPIFVEAVVKALKDFPMVNVSVQGNQILVKKQINIGMAAALPSGNLIVPVIKNADLLNMAGLAKSVNDLASRARSNKLKPEEIQDGTFTLTNVGTFGNVMGTPIINQPQVAILATGAIKKKPAVLETEMGDVIAIRHMMYLSLSYDHRVVDGALGGSFLRRVADYLESFDPNRSI